MGRLDKHLTFITAGGTGPEVSLPIAMRDLDDFEMEPRALTLEGVDSEGLDRLDTRFLRAIIEQYGGGPVGLEAIAATINDEAETLAEVVEPFLLKIGFLIRTPTGRKATPPAYAHLGLSAPAAPGGQGQLPL